MDLAPVAGLVALLFVKEATVADLSSAAAWAEAACPACLLVTVGARALEAGREAA